MNAAEAGGFILSDLGYPLAAASPYFMVNFSHKLLLSVADQEKLFQALFQADSNAFFG